MAKYISRLFADLAALDLVAGIAERGERLVLRVVDQDVAVGQEEDLGPAVVAARVPGGRPELPADLEGDDGLAGAGAIVSRRARWPVRMAWTARLMAISW